MINPITRWLIIGLIITATAAVGLLAYQNKGLRGDNNLLTVERNNAVTQVKSQQKIIATLEENAKANERSHSRLLANIAGTKNLITKHEQTIRTLEQENEQLKIWSNTRLPDAVISLRRRPAITGGESYRNWLSERDTLPVTGIKPADQR